MAIKREEALAAFNYDNGNLYWKIKPSNPVSIGDLAGNVGNCGYRLIGFRGLRYQAHRIIWIMHFDLIAEGMEIDHVNHNRTDNRIENLRLVDRKENRRNCSISSNNKSRATGVYMTRHGKWHAQITVDRRKIHLGLFVSLKDAATARRKAEVLYGFNYNHGVDKCL